MKKKNLFIFIVLILITLVIGVILFNLYFTDKKTSNEINIEKDERESIPIDNPNDIKENFTVEVEEDNNINEENSVTENITSNNINSSISVDKNDNKNDTKETSKNSTNKGKTNKNEDSKVVEENKENDNNSTTNETKSDDNKDNDDSEKQEIWEALGMTKDQYYNEPLFSWERVDFKTMAECLNYGDNYEPYLNGEVLYNCRDVVSASGNYLGVMFETEKLK